MQRLHAVVMAGLVALAAPVLSAQRGVGSPPPPASPSNPFPQPTVWDGTGAISGVVTDETTHAPIPGVLVYLGFQGRGAVGPLSRQLSDEKGRFVFTDLPPGRNYFINASKPGYLEGSQGTGAGGQLGGLITLEDGQWFADAAIVMRRPASISGTVVDEHGDPAVGVLVRVLARLNVAGRPRLAAGAVARTDDRGVYRIAALPPGKYLVHVPIVQQSFPAGMTAAELAGLSPEQAAAGRGIPDGPPAIDAANGMRLVVGAFAAPHPSAGRALTYPPTFYPGTPTSNAATVVTLGAGDDRQGIDVALRPAPAVTISGVLEGPADALTGLAVRLVPEDLEDLGAGSEAATATLGADGRFTLFNVPPGTYTLDARRTLSELQFRSPLSLQSVTLPATPGVAGGTSGSGSIASSPMGTQFSTRSGRGPSAYYARTRVVVADRPIDDLRVPMKRASVIRGTIVTEAGTPAPPGPGGPNGPPIYAEPADGNLGAGMPLSTRPAPDTFLVEGLTGSSYLLRMLAVGNSTPKSIVDATGVDHLVTPFDTSTGRDYDVVITLTDKRTQLSGTAADARGQQVNGAIVVVFPVERAQWTNYGLSPLRVRAIPTSTSGTYQLVNLPAGEYYVAGVPGEQRDTWQDPVRLAALAPLAARVTLAWGEVKTQPVRVVTLP